MSQEFYELQRNFDRFQPEGAGEFGDGYLETKFDNWEEVDLVFSYPVQINLIGNKGVVLTERKADMKWNVVKAQMPASLTFVGFDDLFAYTDYPYILETRLWPIMSRRMLTVLLSLGDFPHQVIPIIFKHTDNLSSNDIERNEASLINNNDFVVLQLLEHLDALDMEKSDYTKTPYESNPKAERIDIHRMVLKKPVTGFPHIFRAKENEIPLYVSAEAKEALEEAGIQGLDFSSWNIGSS